MTSGSEFRDHMARIHGSKASVSKRFRPHELSKASPTASAVLPTESHRPPSTDRTGAMNDGIELGQRSYEPYTTDDDVVWTAPGFIDHSADVDMSSEEEGANQQETEHGIRAQSILQAEEASEDGEGL